MNKFLQRTLACALLAALLLTATAAAAAVRFTDVPASHWAAKDISRCVELGLFRGETASRFGAGHQMTRAAFAVVLNRFFGWEPVTPAVGTYTDVQDPGAWYYSAVETAYANGAITRQTEDFRPREPITREEMAVMLVRALGYGTIAGLAQDLPMPFTDVDSGVGYIAMAYELGIVSGTSATTFSPDRTATREQAAVMLMRLYDKVHSAPPALWGIAFGKEPGDYTGFDAVAITGGRLTASGGVRVLRPDQKREETFQTAIREDGAKALLQVTGVSSALNGKTAETAEALAAAVENGGYDGLYLDLPRLKDSCRDSLTALVQALEPRLGERLLYVAAEAPAWQGEKPWKAYDYAALGAAADRLVLRVAPYEKTADGFVAAPPEPLEEVYYALAELNGAVPGEKLSLLLTTTGIAWQGERSADAVSAAEIAELLADERHTESYWSNRYACAFLLRTADRQTTTVWYLDGRAAAERAKLGAFFGVDQVCLSDLDSVSPGLLAALG